LRSPLAEAEREKLIEAILPDVAFDGWTHAALRRAARRTGIPFAEAMALFPRGAPDLVAASSRWADLKMLDRLDAMALDGLGTSARVRLAIEARFEVLGPYREAVRRGLAVLAMPQHVPLGCRLLYDTVDAIWHAAGDAATDFSFYTKRATLAGLYSAAVIYWLDDRSEGAADTMAFIDRRLADLRRFGGMRGRVEELAARLPNPFRLLRPMR
jgi:ubiquinone biosynthesis protein COQ9